MKRKSGLANLNTLTTTNGARAAIYIRVSSTMQVEDGFSLVAQLKACQKFAADRNWHVIEVCEEPGVSGKDDQRPAFQRMIRDARAGNFNVILTHKLDRFSRSILDVLTYLRDLNEWGVSYASATEHFDFSTPMGKMQLHIMAALAQWYLDNLSQEVTKGKKARAEAGYWNGNLPFGYRAGDARTIKINEKEAEAIRLAFKLCAAGFHSYVEIAQVLNQAGYQPHGKGKRAGRPFTKSSIRALLMNRFYLGYAKYRRPEGWKQFDYFRRYLREKARVELALAQLQPAVQPALNVQEAARLLQSYGGLIKQATSEEQKTFFATVLSEVFVENKKIVAIRPRPNYYDLLRLSLVRPNGFEPSQPCGH